MRRPAVDYTGVVFGSLTILDFGKVVGKNRIVSTLCVCGVYKKIRIEHITTGGTTSCGCHTHHFAVTLSKTLKNNKQLPFGEAARNSLYGKYKRVARKRGYIWELSDDQFYTLTKGNCHYCGVPANQVHRTQYKSGVYIYNGVDRKNNTVGYTSDNCVSCCTFCNKAKSTTSYDDFIAWVARVHSYQQVRATQ